MHIQRLKTIRLEDIVHCQYKTDKWSLCAKISAPCIDALGFIIETREGSLQSLALVRFKQYTTVPTNENAIEHQRRCMDG